MAPNYRQLSWLIRMYLSQRIDELQNVIMRYEAFPPCNIEEIEVARREIAWRRYAVSGLKLCHHQCTPKTVERMMQPYLQNQELLTHVTLQYQPDPSGDLLRQTGD